MAAFQIVFMSNLILSEVRPEFSTGMFLDETAAITAGLVVRSLSGSSAAITVTLEAGNELDNWKTIVSPLFNATSVGLDIKTVGPIPNPLPNQISLPIAARFVRLRAHPLRGPSGSSRSWMGSSSPARSSRATSDSR
jgi:hypothetical protein